MLVIHTDFVSDTLYTDVCLCMYIHCMNDTDGAAMKEPRRIDGLGIEPGSPNIFVTSEGVVSVLVN